MTNNNCQFDGIWNHLGNAAWGLSVSGWHFPMGDLTIQRLETAVLPAYPLFWASVSVTAIAGVDITLC